MYHINMAHPLLCEAPVSSNIEAITSNKEPNVTKNDQPTGNQVPDRSEFMIIKYVFNFAFLKLCFA